MEEDSGSEENESDYDGSKVSEDEGSDSDFDDGSEGKCFFFPSSV